jgi:hypothetical protein
MNTELSILTLPRRRERKTGAHGGPSLEGNGLGMYPPLEISSRGPLRLIDRSRRSESRLTKPGSGKQLTKPVHAGQNRN